MPKTKLPRRVSVSVKQHQQLTSATDDLVVQTTSMNSKTKSHRNPQPQQLKVSSWSSSLRPARGGSVVWVYFQFESEERRRTVCGLCGHTMSWDPHTNSTSNMLKHLRCRHPDHLARARDHRHHHPDTAHHLVDTLLHTFYDMGKLHPPNSICTVLWLHSSQVQTLVFVLMILLKCYPLSK